MYTKKHIILTCVSAIIVGIFTGALGFWYFTIELPHNKALALAQKQQEELERMVRTGDVISVTPDEIKILVKDSGEPDQVGKEISCKSDDNTRIQQGQYVINPRGGKIDLTKCVSVGKTVNLMVKGDKILNLHWEIGS